MSTYFNSFGGVGRIIATFCSWFLQIFIMGCCGYSAPGALLDISSKLEMVQDMSKARMVEHVVMVKVHMVGLAVVNKA